MSSRKNNPTCSKWASTWSIHEIAADIRDVSPDFLQYLQHEDTEALHIAHAGPETR